MRLPAPQPSRTGFRLAAVVAVALGLGGCVGRGETTGSVSLPPLPSAEADIRASSDELGRRYEAEPNNSAVAMQYARTLRAIGQRVQAVAVLQQAAMREPRNLPLLAAYGKALADAGRLKEASEVLARAHLPERPDWRILSVQGTIADQLGDFEGAQRYYQTALNIAPGEPSILSNQGLSYALAKRPAEAEAILRIASADPRADGRVRQNLALVLGLQGKFADADAILKRDMPPAEAAATLASIKRMVAQPNSWKTLRQTSEARTPDAKAGAGQG